jgi:type I restriction enzyme M protein
MLDAETKRRIDSLRQILVGKIPDPKSQVEQITTGLIYKFMTDMDNESISLGGKASFFTGEFEKYKWENLFDSKLSGDSFVKLYSEAIESMYYNPNAPQLFREIFKNTYLPFKDPAVLRMFLKDIGDFHYSHSEKLGDAYEYLLSFLGSQGGAGQFRTPRHIIDFLVAVISPKKNERILDPACGTAGFLISAFKHISESSTLSASERLTLTKNIVGYDIDPLMVRLALVNLYLHKFTNPSIEEYDNLTSEEKWNDYFDIILANPPFFSPKGGIKPHSKFSLKSKKAEVLFIDFITTHLKENGRAGIIVPDGIVANSPNTYIKLRKSGIEDLGLYCVVSLPSGIFLPYSSAKTSILFYDKKISALNNKILFLEIFNDGYQLSQTRKAIPENDLPDAKQLIHNYREALENKKELIGNYKNLSWFLVPKADILNTPAVSLSGKRYKDDIHIKSKYKVINLDDEYIEEKKVKSDTLTQNVWSVSNSMGFVPSEDYFAHKISSDDLKNYKKINKHCFAYNPARVNVGSIALNESSIAGLVSPMYIVFKIKDESILHPKYLLLLLKSKFGIKQIRKFADGAIRQTLSFPNLKYIKIPLPPVEEQIKLIQNSVDIDNLKLKIKEKENFIKNDVSSMWGVEEDEIEMYEEINEDEDDSELE